jgi:hypothetical protein
MRKLAGIALLGALGIVALPAWAADTPPGCAWLCGSWVLDAAHSDPADTAVDAALAKYKEPKARKPRRREADPVADADARVEDELKPVYDRPLKAQMRKLLLALATPPASLVLTQRGDEEIVIRPAGGAERHAFPDEPHSLVDAEGTARITTRWKHDALIIEQKYDRKSWQTETYTLLPNGTLQVSLELERPGAKKIELKRLYRRG